jgi:hypothetical protein
MTRGWIIGFLILAMCAFGAVGYLFWPQHEIGGRPLSEWLARLDHPTDLPAARKALQDLGPGVVPDLVAMLHSKDWPHRNRIIGWVSKHKKLESFLNLGPAAETKKYRALGGIACLGPAARSALPEILPLLTNDSTPIKIRAYCAFAAVAPGPDTVRAAVPALMNGLMDPDPMMRHIALDTVNGLHPLPREATLAFFGLLCDPDQSVRNRAQDCLVARTNTIVLPMLDIQLHDADSFVVAKALRDISIFGKDATGSVPRVRELCTNFYPHVRIAATNALHAITGEAVARGPSPGADITFNFQSVPVMQLMDIYDGYAGRRVTPPSGGWPGTALLSGVTPYSLTKAEAMQLIEAMLKEQAHIVLQHSSDGSISAVVQ